MSVRRAARAAAGLLALALLCGCGAAAPAPEKTPSPLESPAETPAPTAEPSARRELTAEELETLSAAIGWDYGFLLSSYCRPEEIDWRQVFYAGAGIGSEASETAMEEYLRCFGGLYTGLTCIRREALERCVEARTGLPYRLARRPLDWFESSDGCLLFAHGDTNHFSVRFTQGFEQDGEYELYYTGSGQEDRRACRFVLRARYDGGRWLFLSNLPDDEVKPLTLLELVYAETREEAEALGATRFESVEALPSDEPMNWRWAVIRSNADGLRFTVERFYPDTVREEIFSQSYGLQRSDETLFTCVLNEGECFALWVNQPWHPRLRLTASLGARWGEYWFGEDNWLHLGDADTRYLIGHDRDSEGRGCAFRDEAELIRFLQDAPWAVLDPDSGELLAAVVFRDDRTMAIDTGELCCECLLEFGRIDGGDGPPDLLGLQQPDGDAEIRRLLPEDLLRADLGRFSIEAIQLDGEQRLILRPVSDEETALDHLLPGLEGRRDGFLLSRRIGTSG